MSKIGARFVWVSTFGQVRPEKWPADATAAASFGFNRERVAEHMISEDEAMMSLAELSAKYPAPLPPPKETAP